MIVAQFNFDGESKTVIVVVLEPENISRMRKADPATLESWESGGPLAPPKYPLNMSLLIAYEEDTKFFLAMVQQKIPEVELLQYLERSRKFILGKDGLENAKEV